VEDLIGAALIGAALIGATVAASAAVGIAGPARIVMAVTVAKQS
jgi:hypothetical protein